MHLIMMMRDNIGILPKQIIMKFDYIDHIDYYSYISGIYLEGLKYSH